MDSLTSGLQIYSTIKNSFFLIILCCVCSCVSYCLFDTMGRNYMLAKNSQITFKHFSDNIPTENCSVNAPSPDCKYVNEYYDNNNKHFNSPYNFVDPKKLPVVGNTTIYYEDKNPQNHVNSFIHPTHGVLIILAIVIVLLIAASINLYFISTNKTYGAVVGGIEATSDIFSIFKSKS